MTIRAVVLGLLGACFIAGVGHLNDAVAKLPFLVGNHLPTSVFGILFILAILVNPVLRRLRARWSLNPPELAVIVGLMLVACSVPCRGLMRGFPVAVTMPIHLNKDMVGWRKHKLLSYVPESLMPAGGKADSKVVDGFVRGWQKPDQPIGLGDVPWSEWSDPLLSWMPLVVLLALAVVSLSLIVHRQWTKHESLRYPIADFTSSLMGQSQETGVASIFHSRLFWLGLAIVLGINIVNGLHAWFPNSIEIPTKFWLAPLSAKLPKVPRAWTLAALRFYPTVVAFGFVIAAEVSFSLGISQIVYIFLAVPFVKAGMDFSDNNWSGGVNSWQRFGSYVGIALILLYTGRRYYWGVLKQAVTFRRQERVEVYAAWAFRIFLLSVMCLIVVLSRLGLDWPLAVVAVLSILLMFLVMSRVNAESGLFVIAPYWTPMAIVTGLFGVAAAGPKALVVLGLFSMVFSMAARESLMPFLVNGLKVCETFKIRPARVGWAAVGTFAIVLAIAVPVGLWANQNYGAQKDFWVTTHSPVEVFDAVGRATSKLTRSGELKTSNALTGWQRITHMDPDKRFLWAAGVGLFLVLSFSMLRLRYTWWPIHPVIFVMWGSYSMGYFHYSFLLGWLIRVMVMKFGGTKTYRQVKILMFGVIAGEILGKLIFMIVGAIYYAKTGQKPVTFGLDPS